MFCSLGPEFSPKASLWDEHGWNLRKANPRNPTILPTICRKLAVMSNSESCAVVVQLPVLAQSSPPGHLLGEIGWDQRRTTGVNCMDRSEGFNQTNKEPRGLFRAFLDTVFFFGLFGIPPAFSFFLFFRGPGPEKNKTKQIIS